MIKLYCKIINGDVTDAQPLPESFKTKDDIWITGFNHLSAEEVLPHGFYEFIMPNVNYNKETQDVRYYNNVLNPDKKTVSPKYEIVTKTFSPTVSSSNYNQTDFDLIESLLNPNLPEKKLKNI